MGPANARFASIPRGYSGCIYVCELTNGIVKVGFSRNPRTRMVSLARQVRRQFAADIARFFIGADMSTREAIRAESAALVCMRKIAPAVPGYLEFFTGITFDSARAVVALHNEVTADKASA
jgi:hypothetical protein